MIVILPLSTGLDEFSRESLSFVCDLSSTTTKFNFSRHLNHLMMINHENSPDSEIAARIEKLPILRTPDHFLQNRLD